MRNSVIILLIVHFFVSGCSGSSSNDEMFLRGYEGTNNNEISEQGGLKQNFGTKETVTKSVLNQDVEKKIIKTADISIEVKDFNKARIALDELLKKHKAYFSNEKQSNYDYETSSTITIRLQSDDFDSLLNEISSLAHKTNNKEIHVTDVTEEFIDVVTRLKNKKQVEQQYLELLKRANTIDEILKVNEHLRVLREEIESKEGRLKYLENQVSYSTINLYMYQKSEQAYSGFSENLIEGFKGGWKGILAFIIGLTYIWPLLLLIAGTVWIIRKRVKKKKSITAN